MATMSDNDKVNLSLTEMVNFVPMLVTDMQSNPQDYPELCETCDGEGCKSCYYTGGYSQAQIDADKIAGIAHYGYAYDNPPEHLRK